MTFDKMTNMYFFILIKPFFSALNGVEKCILLPETFQEKRNKMLTLI